MPSRLRFAIFLLVVLAGAWFLVERGSALERQAADSLGHCMRGNGGVHPSWVSFSISDQVIDDVTLRYQGKGSALFDAVYDSCLLRVADDLDLEIALSD